MTFRSPCVYALGERGVSFKKPHYEALVAPALFDPGVNAWARENPTNKLGHYLLSVTCGGAQLLVPLRRDG